MSMTKILLNKTLIFFLTLYSYFIYDFFHSFKIFSKCIKIFIIIALSNPKRIKENYYYDYNCKYLNSYNF